MLESTEVQTPSAVHARACGKVILAGEHAVVYGNEAIAIPLSSRQISINILPAQGPLRHKSLPNLLLSQAFKLLQVEEPQVQLRYFSTLPISSGLGSSAALCMAVLRAAARYSQIYLSREEEAQLTNDMEIRFHGSPSGLDANTIAHERAISFRKGHSAEPLNVQCPKAEEQSFASWPFVLVHSAEPKSTKEMVGNVAIHFTGERRAELLDGFAISAAQVKTGLTNGDMHIVSEGMNLAHRLLDEIGVVTAKMHDIISYCLQLGAKSAKITGAGGGGCIVALLDPSRQRQQLEALKAQYGKGRIMEALLRGER